MTTEERSQALELARNLESGYYTMHAEIMMIARALIGRETQVTAIGYEKDGFGSASHIDCHQFVYIPGQSPTYCPNCGVRLEWK